MKRLFVSALFAAIILPVIAKNSPKLNLHDGYFDQDYCLESYYELSGKFLRVELFGKSGTFNIYCRSDEGKEKPLLAHSDLCESSGFILKVDETIYRLNKDRRVLRELRHLQNGAQLVYTTDGNVRFVIDFSFVSSNEEYAADLVKVSTYVINFSGVPHEIGVKGIFDTSCGEVSSVHFTTEAGSKIRNECGFTAAQMQRERTVVSSDGLVSFQFVLDGLKVSPVESVAFANVDELYRMDWDGILRKGRGFTNSRSYDNSALMVKWPGFSSSTDEKIENTFFIAAASDGKSPRGLYYVDKVEPSLPADSTKADEAEKIAPKTDKRTDVDFIIPPIKDYQLDPGYIQDLIDRIDALQSSEHVDQKTISHLNAELDAILEKLRRQ